MKTFAINEAQLNAILSGVQMNRLSQLEQIGIQEVVNKVLTQVIVPDQPKTAAPSENTTQAESRKERGQWMN
jgi:hypothetical protein